MIRCAHPVHGAPGPPGDRSRRFSSSLFPQRGRTGFTLLEMCMVLFIIALLVGLTLPSMQSALTEQAVRKDAHQLALMVKTAMIQSAEQHRAYVIDVTPTSMALHPLGAAPADPNAPPSTDDDDSSAESPTQADVEVSTNLDPPNQLLAPDPQRTNAWVPIPPVTWVFEPGELCTAPRVRLKRGEAWLEMSFNALTGNVENEANYLP